MYEMIFVRQFAHPLLCSREIWRRPFSTATPLSVAFVPVLKIKHKCEYKEHTELNCPIRAEIVVVERGDKDINPQ